MQPSGISAPRGGFWQLCVQGYVRCSNNGEDAKRKRIAAFGSLAQFPEGKICRPEVPLLQLRPCCHILQRG